MTTPRISNRVQARLDRSRGGTRCVYGYFVKL